MTNIPIKLGLTATQFTEYCNNLKPTKFTDTGTPIAGCILHNTYLPDLKMVNNYLETKKWTAPQLIDNWWVSYQRMKWRSGPHLFIFPNDLIYIATRLDERGTHSPSYNKAYWGVEVIGDYSHEILPENMKQLTIHAMAVLYKTLGKTVTDKNFHFHGEDPKTSHKGCPGKNIGTKQQWMNDVNADLLLEKHK